MHALHDSLIFIFLASRHTHMPRDSCALNHIHVPNDLKHSYMRSKTRSQMCLKTHTYTLYLVCIQSHTCAPWHTLIHVRHDSLTDVPKDTHIYPAPCVHSVSYKRLMTHSYTCTMTHSYTCTMTHSYTCTMTHSYTCTNMCLRPTHKPRDSCALLPFAYIYLPTYKRYILCTQRMYLFVGYIIQLQRISLLATYFFRLEMAKD